MLYKHLMTKTTLIYISTNRTLNIVAYRSIISVYNRPEWSWYKSGIHCITRLDDHCHTKLGFMRNNLRFLKKCGRLIFHRKKWASSRREKKREKNREKMRTICSLMLAVWCRAVRLTDPQTRAFCHSSFPPLHTEITSMGKMNTTEM